MSVADATDATAGPRFSPVACGEEYQGRDNVPKDCISEIMDPEH